MSNALELVVSTIQKFLLEASPSDADILPGSNSHLFLLIFSQLQRTHRLLEDFSKELVLDWHGLIYEELYRVVTRIITLVRYPGDISIPVEARGEHFLETLLDLRWWTWVLALQVGTLLTDPTLYSVYFGTFVGVLEVKVSSLPLGGDAVSRRLPSYSFELWQQGREGRLREILQSESGGDRLRDHGQSEADMLLTDVRDIHAELPDFKIKQLGPKKFRDAGKPSSIGDYLPIDLTQDLLGASSTGYVIRTTCSNGQGRSFSCALKRIDTMDDKPPDLARLCHPHVVHLLHHWRENSGLHCKDRERMPNSPFMTFLVMELMDGDLAKLMTRTKKAGVSPFSLHVAVDLMLQIAKGMLYLHEMGVSHPHLKCDNVLFRAENKTQPAFQVGDVRVKLGGFGCSRMANVDTKNRDVFCFGLTCLEILTGDDWCEDIYGADRVPNLTIPEMTPPILKHCISSCFSINLTFSEVVMLLLLAQCQIMQTCKDETMLCTGSLHINEAETNIQDLASSSTSRGGLNEVFHVHQLHPQVGEVSTSVQITLIFFHGFPKVSEEWRMTWMTRDNKLVWPQKWLPEDLGGDIRVLSVSFDDHLNVSSNQTIENLLQILILSGTWKLGGIEQAIVLVGHSFGGVIIKSLVTEAQKLAQKTVVNSVDFEEVMMCKKFLKRLASIVLYSVPHALTNTEFENYISGCSNTRVLQRSSLLKSLSKDDDFIPKMIQLSRDFESAVPHKTKVLAFVEGKPMSKKCFLVSKNSREGQSLSWEWHKVDKDNHFEVCRPDSKSHIGYKILLNHLLEMCVMFTYDCTSPTINVRRQSWKVIGTVFIVICKFKKLLDKRSKSFSTKSDIHSTKLDMHARRWEIETQWSTPSSARHASEHSTRLEIEETKKFEGIDELNNEKGYMRRPGLQEVVVPVSRSGPRFCAHSLHCQYSDFDPERIERLEVMESSSQSLADQWRIQLAPLHGGSSGTSLSSAEELRSVLPDAVHGEPLSHFNNNELSMAPSYQEASGNLELKIPQKIEDHNGVQWAPFLAPSRAKWGSDTITISSRALGPVLNTNEKPRASRGFATDPQSIAAQVNRERVAERLKTLQGLVPNGTKVDVVTMLEKAKDYIKFLEHQLELLKSDENWKLAMPSIYEGIDLSKPQPPKPSPGVVAHDGVPHFQSQSDPSEAVTEVDDFS